MGSRSRHRERREASLPGADCSPVSEPPQEHHAAHPRLPSQHPDGPRVRGQDPHSPPRMPGLPQSFGDQLDATRLVGCTGCLARSAWGPSLCR